MIFGGVCEYLIEVFEYLYIGDMLTSTSVMEHEMSCSMSLSF
jgi:hypothetical protein